MSSYVFDSIPAQARSRRTIGSIAWAILALFALTGCQAIDPSSHIIFLDGAGNFGSATKVKSGLRRAGYRGEFEGFVWTSFLGWGVDHLVRANSDVVADKLAARIMAVRRQHPDGYLAVMGLSAGSAAILGGLEHLPEGQTVDDVVLFQPSVASDRELTRALEHVRRRMIATHCRWDAILAATAISADQHLAKPAGQIGFRTPRPLSRKQRRQYIKLLSIPWQKRYASAGWGGLRGWHISSTSPGFVERYIAPYILTSIRYAKSRALRDRLDARSADWQGADESQAEQPEPRPTENAADRGDVDEYPRGRTDASNPDGDVDPESEPRTQPPAAPDQPVPENRRTLRNQPEGDRRLPPPANNPKAPADAPSRDEAARERPPTRPGL